MSMIMTDVERAHAISSKLAELTRKTESLEQLLSSRRLDILKDGPLNSGDTAFLIISTTLVFFISIPGVGLYYAGMVHVKNALTTVMQTFSIACVITAIYMIFGYSLAFGNPAQGGLPVNHDQRTSGIYGDGSRFWFHDMSDDSVHQSAPSMPESVFATYQLAIAILSSLLVVGSLADRIRYPALLIFSALWHIAVYCPIAHATWHPDGLLHKAGVMDYAGGNVVHICSGASGLVAAVFIGRRTLMYDQLNKPHNVLVTYIGACLMWIGWTGFNSGSTLYATSRSGHSALNSQISSGTSALCWLLLDMWRKKPPSTLAALSGAISGLVAITPACGWVDQTGAFFIGVIAAPWCYAGSMIKTYAGYDDAFDAFGVHLSGGLLGGILTGFFANPVIYGPYVITGYLGVMSSRLPNYYPGVFYAINESDQGLQLGLQVYGCFATVLYSTAVTALLLKGVYICMDMIIPEEEHMLDMESSMHGMPDSEG